MAIDMRITPACPAEVGGPSTVATAFSALLAALSRFISAESDLTGVDFFDPALAAWRHDAESAQDDVIDSLRAVREAASERAGDIPMQRLAILIASMMGSEDPEEFSGLNRLASVHAPLFRCPGSTPSERRVDHMLVAGLALLDELATLSIYNGSSPGVNPGSLTADSEVMLALT